MNKITEINLISEGMQLRDIIDGQYTYTGLAKRFGVSRSSIERYLNSMQVTTPKFQQNIEELFQKPLYEIINSVEKQIRDYIIDIKDNIKHYNDKDDIKVMLDVYDYANTYSPLYDQMMAKGNLALYRYNMGHHTETERMLKEVIDTSEKNDFKELVAYYSIQLAFVELGYNDLKKCRKTLLRADRIIEEAEEGEISTLTLFNYYYFYGVVLRRSNRIPSARGMFEKAKEYATDDTKISRILLNIGLTYHDEKKYTTAIKKSREALEKASGNIELQSVILNNIANFYFVKEELGKAHYYLSLAMENFSEDFDPSRKILIYDTYLDFNAQEGTKLLGVIIEMFDNCTVINQYQAYLSTCIEKLFEQLKKIGDLANIKKLMLSLKQYCRLEGEKRYLGELKVLFVDIMQYLEDEDLFELERGLK